jgi:hypothetical protein
VACSRVNVLVCLLYLNTVTQLLTFSCVYGKQTPTDDERQTNVKGEYAINFGAPEQAACEENVARMRWVTLSIQLSSRLTVSHYYFLNGHFTFSNFLKVGNG